MKIVNILFDLTNKILKNVTNPFNSVLISENPIW